jgi:hypothetical protein
MLCILAAATLDWNAPARSQPTSYSAPSFSLITIHIDRSQRFVLPNEVAGVPLP